MTRRELPVYHQVTFRRGTVSAARFAADGGTLVYSAAWDGGRSDVFQADSTARRPAVGFPEPCCRPWRGEMALVQRSPAETCSGAYRSRGRVRPIAESVASADWAVTAPSSRSCGSAGRGCGSSSLSTAWSTRPRERHLARVSPAATRLPSSTTVHPGRPGAVALVDREAGEPSSPTAGPAPKASPGRPTGARSGSPPPHRRAESALRRRPRRAAPPRDDRARAPRPPRHRAERTGPPRHNMMRMDVSASPRARARSGRCRGMTTPWRCTSRRRAEGAVLRVGRGGGRGYGVYLREPTGPPPCTSARGTSSPSPGRPVGADRPPDAPTRLVLLPTGRAHRRRWRSSGSRTSCGRLLPRRAADRLARQRGGPATAALRPGRDRRRAPADRARGLVMNSNTISPTGARSWASARPDRAALPAPSVAEDKTSPSRRRAGRQPGRLGGRRAKPLRPPSGTSGPSLRVVRLDTRTGARTPWRVIRPRTRSASYASRGCT